MHLDEYEQEIEFDRLCIALTGDGSDQLVQLLHASQKQFYGTSKLIHLRTVSELAFNHAVAYYEDHDFNEQRYRKTSCRLLGLLHETMDWGASFEDIVFVSDEIVAHGVAALTIDKRLARPKRLELYVNQLGRAPDYVQIAKLADLQHDATCLLAYSVRKTDKDLLQNVRGWVDDVRWLYPALLNLKESLAMAGQVSDLWTKIEELERRCKAVKVKRR